MSDTSYYTPKIILAVAAHADDIDVTCGGSLARWANEGAVIYYLILTDSSCGSDDEDMTREQLTALRKQEQRDAAKLIGAMDVFFYDYCDGTLEATQDVKRDIARIIRNVQPDTIIGMDPTAIYDVDTGWINHTDHRAVGQATIDAVFPLSRDRLSLPTLLSDENLKPHKAPHLLLTNFTKQNYIVDITETFDKKLDAIMLHKSQFGDDRERMASFMRERSEVLGGKIDTKYAEGFVRIDVRF